MTSSHFPVVDLALPAEQVQAALRDACRDWGFFNLIGHGFDPQLCEAAHAHSCQFFQMDTAVKKALERDLDQPWGFYDRELTKNSRDRKEIFDFSPLEDAPWPEALPTFRDTLERYAEQVQLLSMRLLGLITTSLACEPEGIARCFANDHSSFCRLNYYPCEVPDEAETTADAPLAELGISEHTDAGALTVLMQDQYAGLQVFHDKAWHTVPPLAGAFTINVGDMMQVWSNDTYCAPLHRVLASTEASRYSIAYFLNPSYDAVIDPCAVDPKYRSVPWREFRDLRAQGDYGDYGEEVQISHYRK